MDKINIFSIMVGRSNWYALFPRPSRRGSGTRRKCPHVKMKDVLIKGCISLTPKWIDIDDFCNYFKLFTTPDKLNSIINEISDESISKISYLTKLLDLIKTNFKPYVCLNFKQFVLDYPYYHNCRNYVSSFGSHGRIEDQIYWIQNALRELNPNPVQKDELELYCNNYIINQNGNFIKSLDGILDTILGTGDFDIIKYIPNKSCTFKRIGGNI